MVTQVQQTATHKAFSELGKCQLCNSSVGQLGDMCDFKEGALCRGTKTVGNSEKSLWYVVSTPGLRGGEGTGCWVSVRSLGALFTGAGA